MDALLNRLLTDPLSQLTIRQFLELAMQHFYAFTLVLVRMSGLMAIGPLFGQSFVPVNIRVLLVLVMSILITPTLHGQSGAGFRRLDDDRNNRLSRSEVPLPLRDRFDRLLERAGKHQDAELTRDEFQAPLRIPSTVLDYAWIGVGEFALGLVLGLGVLIILSGLQLAGELIDQQTGLSLGEISNPGLEVTGSITGNFLFLLGTAVMLIMEPTGGHLLIISALVETFQTLPVGDAFVSTETVGLLRDLVHQSLVLGIQVAAPLIAMMSLVALTMGFLGHSVPQINVLIIGFPIRALVSLMVLGLTFSGASRMIVDSVPAVIDEIRHTLTSL